MLQKLRAKLDQWLTYEPPSTEILPYDYKRMKFELRPGDVILVQGRSRVSRIINAVTRSPWTHAGLYIGRLVDIEDENLRALIRTFTAEKDNVRLVIEDLLDQGTVISPLRSYRHHHLRICRPIGITHADIMRVIRYAAEALGKKYNVRQFLDLARFLLPWSILPRRWGSSLFKTVEGKQEPGICSTLIAEAFASVQFPVLPYLKANSEASIEMYQRNPYLFAPKDFDYSPYFDIIKYPLLHPEEIVPFYRQMPWNKNNELYQDNGILSGSSKKHHED